MGGQAGGGGGARIHSKERDLIGRPRGGSTGGWRRLPERLQAVTVGYKLKSAPAVRETVAGRRLGALKAECTQASVRV